MNTAVASLERAISAADTYAHYKGALERLYNREIVTIKSDPRDHKEFWDMFPPELYRLMSGEIEKFVKRGPSWQNTLTLPPLAHPDGYQVIHYLPTHNELTPGSFIHPEGIYFAHGTRRDEGKKKAQRVAHKLWPEQLLEFTGVHDRVLMSVQDKVEYWHTDIGYALLNKPVGQLKFMEGKSLSQHIDEASIFVTADRAVAHELDRLYGFRDENSYVVHPKNGETMFFDKSAFSLEEGLDISGMMFHEGAMTLPWKMAHKLAAKGVHVPYVARAHRLEEDLFEVFLKHYHQDELTPQMREHINQVCEVGPTSVLRATEGMYAKSMRQGMKDSAAYLLQGNLDKAVPLELFAGMPEELQRKGARRITNTIAFLSYAQHMANARKELGYPAPGITDPF